MIAETGENGSDKGGYKKTRSRNRHQTEKGRDYREYYEYNGKENECILLECDAMMEERLVKAGKELVAVIEKTVDDNLPNDMAKTIKNHSLGAAVAGVASGWIPGAGSTAAVVISAGFIWTMYGKIGNQIGLSFTKNLLKSLASGIATNIAAFAVASIALGAVASFVPGIGSAASAVISGGTCYAITIVSGLVYLKLLTRLFKAGEDPSTLDAEELKKAAKTVVKNENIKSVIKEAKESYKVAKEKGEEPEGLDDIENEIEADAE